MTSYDFERTLVDWLDEAGAPQTPDYVDELLGRARRTRQRPAWASLERWLPMQITAARRAAPFPGMAWLLALALLLIIVVVAALNSASTPRLPPPIGPAGNGLIAFEDAEQIFVARVDGSGRRLMSGGVWAARSPEFSPDGTRLAFLSGTGFDVGHLWVAPTDGSHQPINVSGDNVGGRGYYPAISWSPDGRHIALASVHDGAVSILVAASDGSGATAITDQAADRDLPSWSPDGSLIAYRITRRDGSGRSLAIARPDGQQERILGSVTGPEASLSVARWAPDGRRLAYYRIAPDESQALVVDLHGNETPLWPERAGSYADTGIPWAPDGRTIALFTADGLVVVDPDGGNPRRLGNLAYCWIEWSPDGTALYGPEGDRCGGRIRVIPVADPGSATTTMEGVLSWQRVAP
jgi:Tol biopolymer transport system component